MESPPGTRPTETPSRVPEVGLVRYRATNNPIADEEGSQRISAEESMVFFAGKSAFQVLVRFTASRVVIRQWADASCAPGSEEGLEFLFDTCYPDRPIKGNHYIIPRPPSRAAYAHDSGLHDPLLTSFPAEDVCKDLLGCYFRYVHPFLPVVDATIFLPRSDSPRKRSPLLRWSMMFAAANVRLIS